MTKTQGYLSPRVTQPVSDCRPQVWKPNQNSIFAIFPILYFFVPLKKMTKQKPANNNNKEESWLGYQACYQARPIMTNIYSGKQHSYHRSS